MKSNDYNYKHFGFKPYTEESTGRFLLERLEGPKVGTMAPDFSATTLDKKTIKLSDFRGKTVVLEAGSGTCPATIGTTSDMQKLVREYPNITFLLLYVREAHPGERVPAHASFDEKLSCAQRFYEGEHDNRIIVVDDLDGTVHKQYGLFPNFVYVINPQGYVAWKIPWNVPKRLDEVLASLRKNPETKFSEEYLLPDIKHVGFRALRRAGWKAIIDVIRNIPRGIWVRHRLKKIGHRY